jgi:hypothetical protein
MGQSPAQTAHSTGDIIIITCDNISKCIVCPNTARRVMNALDWYGTNCEHIGADPVFACKIPLVESALLAQKVYNEIHGGTARPGSDAHMGLKDILPQSDKL